jgi:hypothetical protein
MTEQSTEDYEKCKRFFTEAATTGKTLSFGYKLFTGDVYYRNIPSYCDKTTLMKVCNESKLFIDSFGKVKFHDGSYQINVYGLDFRVRPHSAKKMENTF